MRSLSPFSFQLNLDTQMTSLGREEESGVNENNLSALIPVNTRYVTNEREGEKKIVGVAMTTTAAFNERRSEMERRATTNE